MCALNEVKGMKLNMKEMLRRDKWWFWFILLIFGGSAVLALIYALVIENVLDKDAWYAKWYYWLIGVLCCFLPAIIMFVVFQFQLLTKVCEKLEVPGSEIYTSPYTWMLCLIVPVLGWILLGVMILYLEIFSIAAIYQGKGEKFIEN